MNHGCNFCELCQEQRWAKSLLWNCLARHLDVLDDEDKVDCGGDDDKYDDGNGAVLMWT